MATRRPSRPLQRRAQPRSRLLALEEAVRTLAIIQTKQQQEISDLKEGMASLRVAVLTEIRDEFKQMLKHLDEKFALIQVLNQDLPERVRRLESRVGEHQRFIDDKNEERGEEHRTPLELKP